MSAHSFTPLQLKTLNPARVGCSAKLPSPSSRRPEVDSRWHVAGTSASHVACSHSQVNHLTRRSVSSAAFSHNLPISRSPNHPPRAHPRTDLRARSSSKEGEEGGDGKERDDAISQAEIEEEENTKGSFDEASLGFLKEVEQLRADANVRSQALWEDLNADKADVRLKSSRKQPEKRSVAPRLDWNQVSAKVTPKRILSPEEEQSMIDRNMDLIIRTLDNNVTVRTKTKKGADSTTADEEEMVLKGDMELTLTALDRLEFYPVNTVEAVHSDFKKRTNKDILKNLSEPPVETVRNSQGLKTFTFKKDERASAIHPQDAWLPLRSRADFPTPSASMRRTEEEEAPDPRLVTLMQNDPVIRKIALTYILMQRARAQGGWVAGAHGEKLSMQEALGWRQSESKELDSALRRAGRKTPPKSSSEAAQDPPPPGPQPNLA